MGFWMDRGNSGCMQLGGAVPLSVLARDLRDWSDQGRERSEELPRPSTSKTGARSATPPELGAHPTHPGIDLPTAPPGTSTDANNVYLAAL